MELKFLLLGQTFYLLFINSRSSLECLTKLRHYMNSRDPTPDACIRPKQGYALEYLLRTTPRRIVALFNLRLEEECCLDIFQEKYVVEILPSRW